MTRRTADGSTHRVGGFDSRTFVSSSARGVPFLPAEHSGTLVGHETPGEGFFCRSGMGVPRVRHSLPLALPLHTGGRVSPSLVHSCTGDDEKLTPDILEDVPFSLVRVWAKEERYGE